MTLYTGPAYGQTAPSEPSGGGAPRGDALSPWQCPQLVTMNILQLEAMPSIYGDDGAVGFLVSWRAGTPH